jgi:flagellar hook-associated protein 1
MSLFSAIQQSSNALRVGQLGLQVVGNNISNANTPGYIRQELVQAPGLGYKVGDSVISQGVRAIGVRQQIDQFVVSRLRETNSQLAYYQSSGEALSQIQDALNELGENDISSALSRFSNAFQDVSNNPQSEPMKSLAIRRGSELAQSLSDLSNRVGGIADRATQQINQVADDINRLSASIAELNRRIVETEGGRLSNSDAVGLRDERLNRLDELGQLLAIQTTEQANGSVTVIVGGDFLVADGLSREIDVVNNSDESATPTEIIFKDTEAALPALGGKLKGLYEQRSGVVAGFTGKLDQFTRDLIRTVNEIHSQGQGSIGFQSLSGSVSLSNPHGPIEQAATGLEINNGSFRIDIHNASTNTSRSFDINIQQLGDGNDTTVNQLVSQIDAVDGIRAYLGNDGQLKIESDSQAISFTFADDSSGVLSNLGINTFFVGDSARTIKVRSEILSDSRLLSISLDGPGSGARNALALTSAFNSAQSQLNGRSLQEVYEAFVGDTAQQINSQETVTDGIENFKNTLEARHLSITGVNLDEEAAKLLMYQRAFQASSKVISTVNELFATLIDLV